MYNNTFPSQGTLRQGIGAVAGIQTVFYIFATLLVIALTVLAVIIIIRLLTGKGFAPNTGKNPAVASNTARLMAVLNERFVKGEIGPMDYQKMKEEILRHEANPLN